MNYEPAEYYRLTSEVPTEEELSLAEELREESEAEDEVKSTLCRCKPIGSCQREGTEECPDPRCKGQKYCWEHISTRRLHIDYETPSEVAALDREEQR